METIKIQQQDNNENENDLNLGPELAVDIIVATLRLDPKNADKSYEEIYKMAVQEFKDSQID
jgi:hypothetical protein